jgi:Zn-dependent protease with chaperone function
MRKTLKNAAFFAAFIGMLALPALADRTVLRPAWNMFTTQQDIEMGRMLADDLERTYRLVDDHNSNAYIDALGKQLTAHAAQTRYPYQFKIVWDDSMNAWALPGGFIYVTSGMLQNAQNEPELAGVLAHSIAHVVLRHGTAEVSQAYSDRVSSTTRRVSINDAMSSLNIRFEPNSIPLTYSRAEEREAAILATQLMYDTGFDAQQLTRVFQSLSNNRSGQTDFLNSHPFLSNQAAVVRTELRNLGAPPRNPRGDSPDFHSVKDRLLAVNNNNRPPNANRGVGGRNLPSSRMVLYSGRDIEFRYPDNWRVSDDGDSITIAPDDGFVSGLLAYGMTISSFDPQGSRYFGRNSFATPGTRADATTLAGATDQLIAHLQQSNRNLRMIQNHGRTRVDGQQAMVVELTNESPVGGMETDWLVTVLRPDGLVRYFVGVAPQNDFSRYQRTFDQIVSTARLLN